MTNSMSKNYYIRNGIEVFDVIEAFDLNFNLGNVVKYVCRAGKKDECIISDLLKARDYIDREIGLNVSKKATEECQKDDLVGLARFEQQV